MKQKIIAIITVLFMLTPLLASCMDSKGRTLGTEGAPFGVNITNPGAIILSSNLSITGIQGAPGAPGAPGSNGTSIVWLGTFAAPPVAPSLDNAYRNSTDNRSYVWNGASWQLMTQDGLTGADGAPGAPGTSEISTSTNTSIFGMFASNNTQLMQATSQNITDTLGYIPASIASLTATNATANDAYNIAITANTTANTANTTANTANTTANDALALAGTANTTATNALALANTANNTATDALALAGTANTTANNALTLATTANTTATHSNRAILDAIQEAFTTALKNSYDWLVANITSDWKTWVDTTIVSVNSTAQTANTTANNALALATTANTTATHSNRSILDATQEAFTTALKNSYDWLVANITADWKAWAETQIATANTTANTANTTANNALALATTANNTANNALALATTANTTATDALSLATTANNTANTANTTATTANETANAALALATTANTTATSALSLATTANTTATNALILATTANSTATTANTTANDAYTIAVTANTTANAALPALLNRSLTITNTYSGITSNWTAGSDLVATNLVYINGSSQLALSDADASGTMPVVAMATGTINTGTVGTFLTYGYYCNTGWTWTVDGLIFASGTAGGLTQTAPSGSGKQVQVIGIAVSATVILFNPQLMVIGL